MAPDLIAESVLIDVSRIQRETLERWIWVLAGADQFDHAEALRREITDLDQDSISERTAA